MNKVILTSFKKSKLFKGEKFSVARWQPWGFKYLELKFLSAIDINGNPLYLSNYARIRSPLRRYKEAWFEMVSEKMGEVYQWFYNVPKEIVLCCWCPHSKSTQEQIKEHGEFACHTGLIGKLLKDSFKDVEIILDEDRKNFLVKEWRP